MTRPGPRPTPVEQQRARGVTPKKRPAVQLVAVEQLPPAPVAPSTLGPTAAAEWERLWHLCAAWLQPTDSALVARYCDMLEERQQIRDTLAADGLQQPGSNGQPRPHALLARLGVLERSLVQHEDRLGLSPAERTRLGVAQVKASTVLDELQARRANRENRGTA